MPDRCENIAELLERKLKLMRELEIHLGNSLAGNRDNSWGADSILKAGAYFERLRQLDEQEKNINFCHADLHKNADVAAKVEELTKIMKIIKKHLAVFHLRLEGGKQLLGDRLKEVTKAKKIKGYETALA